MPVAISGSCLFGHQVFLLVSCIPVVIRKPCHGSQGKKYAAWCGRDRASVAYGWGTNPLKLKNLNQQPLLWFTGNLGWAQKKGSVGLAKGDAHSCSHLLAYLGLPWTEWSKTVMLTCPAFAAWQWQGVCLHTIVHPGRGQPGLPDMAATYSKKGDKRLRLRSHPGLLLHIFLVKEVMRFRSKEAKLDLWMGGGREAHRNGHIHGNAGDLRSCLYKHCKASIVTSGLQVGP